MSDYRQGGKNGGGMLITLLVGMALGAAAVVLSNREMREELMGRLEDLRKRGERKVEEAKKELEEAGAKGRKKAAEELEKAKKEAGSPRH
ncbi:MAG TPA: hypothetical protein VMW04_03405 [Patescibacteria group bacterium]|nr:hypothetical protein [Patescibacteria group bacterium]